MILNGFDILASLHCTFDSILIGLYCICYSYTLVLRCKKKGWKVIDGYWKPD